jgi:hypothetical protein
MGVLDRHTRKVQLARVRNTQRETLPGVVRNYLKRGS